MINNTLALQTKLLEVVASDEVDWENSDFSVPDLDTPYYKAHLLRGKPFNLAIDTMDSEGLGIFQVTLLYPTNNGTVPMETKAQEIMDIFVGQTLMENNTKVRIMEQPYFTMLDSTVDRFTSAVSIAYQTTKI